VKIAKFQERAGHYVVVDGARTGTDYMCAHLREPALAQQGDRVRTGDLLGTSATAATPPAAPALRAVGAPGWYTGGSAFDPIPALRAWDRSS
jgi:murein DD-endopeptidase MepM/ murein hydrolase activator NlpD